VNSFIILTFLAFGFFLASEAQRLAAEHRVSRDVVSELGKISVQIVHAFLQGKMNLCAQEDLDEDLVEGAKDWIIYEDVLSEIASLSRLDAASCAAMLCSAVERCVNQYQSGQISNMDAYYEGLHWTILVIGSFLSDQVENETILIPMEIVDAAISSPRAIQTLCQNLLNLLDFLCDTPNAASTTVMESLWWAICRFMQCYVCCNSSNYSSAHMASDLLTEYGKKTLETTFNQSIGMFQRYQSEPDVLSQVCHYFLIISKNQNLRSNIVSFQEFRLFCKNVLSPMNQFPESMYSLLVESIFRIMTYANNNGNPTSQNGFVTASMSLMYEQFSTLTGSCDPNSQDMQRLSCCLEVR
jgi:hypothetical protein